MYGLAWESLNWGYFPKLVSFLFSFSSNISQCVLCNNYFPVVYLPTAGLFAEDRAAYF